MQPHIIDKLYKVLLERKSADAGKSYVASLYQKGTGHIADKIIEEAGEVVAEAAVGDREKLALESADLLFHLMVLWADQGIAPGDVFKILEQRQGISGHDEKKARK